MRKTLLHCVLAWIALLEADSKQPFLSNVHATSLLYAQGRACVQGGRDPTGGPIPLLCQYILWTPTVGDLRTFGLRVLEDEDAVLAHSGVCTAGLVSVSWRQLNAAAVLWSHAWTVEACL